MFFKDRFDAGRQLAQLLAKYKGQKAIVYAIPRGGIEIADPIASFLDVPIDLLLAHKIGHPYQPEYAIAAVSESGHFIKTSSSYIPEDENWFESQKKVQIQEMKRRREKYLKGRKRVSLKDKIAIVVDDGIATGLTLQVGIKELKDQHPKKIVIAVPVAPKSQAELMRTMVDDFVAIDIPDDFDYLGSVGSYYDRFYQVEDEEVSLLLAKHAHAVSNAS